MSTRRLAAAAIALLALVAAPACSGGGDDDAQGTASGETSSSGTSATGDAVDIEDFQYEPSPAKVKAGTTVTFTNKDGFAHTVTADDKSFDSGNLDEGDAFEHTFDEPGTYEYFCAVHNSMTGSVVVE
ncbi:MAG TPA: cupredoxin family copper-binding protein [Acidimicrobiales bacterium]|jgi:plastocyanin|nr:cupredoxin family copper-binding protein [Acidimicrobiales bacterium]